MSCRRLRFVKRLSLPFAIARTSRRLPCRRANPDNTVTIRLQLPDSAPVIPD
jgi:hypothetical protein